MTDSEAIQNRTTSQLITDLNHMSDDRREAVELELAARSAWHRLYRLEAAPRGLFRVLDIATGNYLAVRGESTLEWRDAWDLFREYSS